MDNLSETVYKKLQKEILNDTYSVGSRLPSERKLAEKYKVSRTTIRDAVKKLEQLGLVKKKPQSGIYVNEYESEASLDLLIHIMQTTNYVDSDILLSLIEFRTLAEVFSARKAARNVNKKETANLHEIIDKMEEHINDTNTLSELNFQLHSSIAKLSGNIVVKLMLNSFKPVYKKYANFFLQLENAVPESIYYLRQAVKAIGSKDENFAAYSMEQAMLYAENKVKEAFTLDDKHKKLNLQI